MKKILVVLFVSVCVAGCVALPSAYDGAKPSRTVMNIDSTTSFEFLFPTNAFDEDMARQRIDEFFASHVKQKGFASYEVVSVSYSDTEIQSSPRKINTRILVRVKFLFPLEGVLKERTSHETFSNKAE